MFEEALRYPTRGDDAVTTILVGGGLGIVGFLIGVVAVVLSIVFVGLVLLPFVLVPALLLEGYSVAVVRHRLVGDPEPPRFEDWSGLFVDGLKATVIGLLYAVPAMVALFVLVVLSVAVTSVSRPTTAATPNVGIAVGGVLLVVVTVALFVYAIGVAYVYPAAVANWVREDDLAAAFSTSALREATLDGRYFVAWVLALVVALVGGTIAQALVIFLLVGFFALFYVQVAVWYLYAEGYADAMGLARGPGGDDGVGGDDGTDGILDGDRQKGYGHIRYGHVPASEGTDADGEDVVDAIERVSDDEDRDE